MWDTNLFKSKGIKGSDYLSCTVLQTNKINLTERSKNGNYPVG